MSNTKKQAATVCCNPHYAGFTKEPQLTLSNPLTEDNRAVIRNRCVALREMLAGQVHCHTPADHAHHVTCMAHALAVLKAMSAPPPKGGGQGEGEGDGDGMTRLHFEDPIGRLISSNTSQDMTAFRMGVMAALDAAGYSVITNMDTLRNEAYKDGKLRLVFFETKD